LNAKLVSTLLAWGALLALLLRRPDEISHDRAGAAALHSAGIEDLERDVAKAE
jgi:hypothetical protein